MICRSCERLGLCDCPHQPREALDIRLATSRSEPIPPEGSWRALVVIACVIAFGLIGAVLATWLGVRV